MAAERNHIKVFVSPKFTTLKPRLHERLRDSKNVILFLSSNTKYSRALKEEIDYAINTLGLPIIVVYPDFKLKTDIANSTFVIIR